MRFINKRILYPIFFLSGILILVLFFSGFSFMEGLETTTPVVPAVNTPTTSTPTTPTPTTPTTVPISVSPATAAIVSSALDSIVQMGVSAVKNSNEVVANMEAAASSTPMPVVTPLDTPVPSSNTPQPTNWVPINTTSTTR